MISPTWFMCWLKNDTWAKNEHRFGEVSLMATTKIFHPVV